MSRVSKSFSAIAGLAAAIFDQAFEVGGEIAHRLVAERHLLGRQHRLERAEDRKRPAAQRRAILHAARRAGCR